MNSLVELISEDCGKTWKKIGESPIQEQPFQSVAPIGYLGQIPRSLILERNGTVKSFIWVTKRKHIYNP